MHHPQPPLHNYFGYCIIKYQGVDARERRTRNMGPLDRVIASSVPFMPKSLVGRVGRRYAAGEEVEDAVRVVRGLAKEGCLATVGVLGEHAHGRAAHP